MRLDLIGDPGVVVSGTASDSHTWNLVYLQLLLEELGRRVHNLGPCVPDDLLVDRCARLRPALVVLSSVNGHGATDGLRVIGRLRERLAGTPIVIGGKLGIAGTGGHAARLRAAGFNAVFEEGAVVEEGLDGFRALVAALPIGAGR